MRELSHHRSQCQRRQRRRGEEGQSLIEFTLILPGLFLIFIGVAIISQGFNLQMILYGAAYEGARVWAKNPPGGDSDKCNPPACDLSQGEEKNFDKYIKPVVRQYITKNGFDGNRVFFFAENPEKARGRLNGITNDKQLVKVELLYPLALPIGNFAGEYSRVLVFASCTMKRGS